MPLFRPPPSHASHNVSADPKSWRNADAEPLVFSIRLQNLDPPGSPPLSHRSPTLLSSHPLCRWAASLAAHNPHMLSYNTNGGPGLQSTTSVFRWKWRPALGAPRPSHVGCPRLRASAQRMRRLRLVRAVSPGKPPTLHGAPTLPLAASKTHRRCTCAQDAAWPAPPALRTSQPSAAPQKRGRLRVILHLLRAPQHSLVGLRG